MRFSLLPTMLTTRITDLPPSFFHDRGVELLMLDFDNTIIPYTTNTPTPEVDAWLREMVASGLPLAVVSNSHKDRAGNFCDGYGISCFTYANKPSRKGFQRCMTHFGKTPDKCMMIGDQIFTDVLGANRSGVRSVLVKSIHNHKFWLKLRHVAEMPFIFLARKRRLKL